MRIFKAESEMFTPVSRFLRHRSFRRQAPEIAFYEYRIDLYAYSERLRHTVAVELKLMKWSRAIEQAMLYQLCADYVFVALPAPEIQQIPFRVLEEHGLGLIAVARGRCREVVRPQRSSAFRADYAELYRRVLIEGA